MLYLTIITVNFLSLFLQIYNIEGVENKHTLFFALRLALMTLMCHLTKMKHNTIRFLHFTQLASQNTSLITVNANFKRMEVANSINKLTTNLYIYRKCDIVHNNIGSVERVIMIVKHLLYT